MSSRREPVAEIGAEDYRIVRHTHDVELAKKLMLAALIKENGCPGAGKHRLDDFCEDFYNPECPHYTDPGKPSLVWVRIQPCLPGTWGHYEGLKYTFEPSGQGKRGAFRAVEFR